jgi:outer membrane autotransporter protein
MKLKPNEAKQPQAPCRYSAAKLALVCFVGTQTAGAFAATLPGNRQSYAESESDGIETSEVLDYDPAAMAGVHFIFRDDGGLQLDRDTGAITEGRATFKDESFLYVDGQKLDGGNQTFHDRSQLLLESASNITGGTQTFLNDSTLDLRSGVISGGKQFFLDHGALNMFSSKITGGEQFFFGDSGINQGSSSPTSIAGGHQHFNDRAVMIIVNRRAISGGQQTFQDDSRLIVGAQQSLTGGRQIFMGRSILEALGPDAMHAGTAVFREQSRLRVRAPDSLKGGASVKLSDSAALELLGNSAQVDTVESLDFHAKAVVRNGGDADVTFSVNPSGGSQPFFHGRMEDGGSGKLALVKQGPATYYLAGENAIAYTGSTEVKEGVLAIRGVAPSASHKSVALNGGWLDISELSSESAKQFELTGTRPERVLRARDSDTHIVAAGDQKTVDQPLGSSDPEDHGKYLVKTGPGKLTLEAENHYIGATRVQEGILSFSKNEQLGQEAVVRSLVLEGGSLELTADIDTDRSLELRTTAAVNTTGTSSHWRSVLQDAEPRTLVKQGSGLLTFKEESHLGSLVVEDGSVSFLETPRIRAAPGKSAVTMGAAASSASFVDGLIRSKNAPAITAEAGDSKINLLAMRATAEGAPLAQTGGSAKLEIDAISSPLAGSLVSQGNSRLQLTLRERAQWTGTAHVQGASQLKVDIASPASRWNVTGNTTITQLANAGTLQFGSADLAMEQNPLALPSSPSGYAALHVKGDYAGDGAIRMRTRVEGDRVLTDRLLIEGDAKGASTLDVALEKTGKTRRLSSVSLVQVGGEANADSFKLAQSEIMLKGSPFKHVLNAYGPKELKAAHGKAADWMLDKKPNWDFRLQIAKENTLGFIVPPVHPAETDHGAANEDAKPSEDEKKPPISPPDTGEQDAKSPIEKPAEQESKLAEPPREPPKPPAPKPPKNRAKLVPQASAYLAAPRALQNYQAEITGTLHRQLQDERERANAAPERAHDGYARVIGLSHSYRSDLDWAAYGIDFSQKSQALQLGGTLLRKHLGDRTVTLGAAATLGSTSINTHGQPSERAHARFDTRDVALTAGIGHRNGFYLDGIVAIGSFDGKVKAGSRHPSAKPHGQSAGVSLAAGKTLRFDNGLVLQPQLQWQFQRLSFASISDKNEIDIKVGTSGSHTLSAGANLSWPQAGGSWTPYAQAHLLTGWGGAPTVRLSGNAFDTGRAGQAAQFTLGARAELGKSTSLHGAVSSRTRLGEAGASGFAGTLGVRYVF